MRFSLRKDIDPGSYGSVGCQEVRGHQPCEDDIILIAKKFMADPEPFRVQVVLTSEEAAILRRSFQQPIGLNPRRAISEKVKKNIKSKVPALISQHVIPMDGAAYLPNWVDGTLERKPRPRSYGVLTYKYDGRLADPPGRVETWEPKRRMRVVDLKVATDQSDSENSEDERAPIAMDEGS